MPVTLELKAGKTKPGETKPVELTSWADKGLREKVSLKDDQKKSYKLLDQVSGQGKTITEKRMKVQLIFEAPASKKLKFLRLKLPVAALGADGPSICYEIHEINAGDTPSASVKTTDQVDKAAKVDKAAPMAPTDKTDKTDKADPAVKTDKTAPMEKAVPAVKADKSAGPDPSDPPAKTRKRVRKKAAKADKGDSPANPFNARREPRGQGRSAGQGRRR